MNTQRKALLIDVTKCVGCQLCSQSCKQLHGFKDTPEIRLSPTAFTVVQERSDRYVRRMCMHCQDPTCVSVCPVGAFEKTAVGAVVYHPDKCMGCRYCLQACPFDVPKYEWNKLAPYVRKCDLCAERVAAGGVPACVEACPVQATIFGNRDEILQEAHRRIGSNSGYLPKIYGAEEVGGTSVFFLSDVPFEKLGLPVGLITQPMPTLTSTALSDVPIVVSVGASLLAALYWITQRREEVTRAEAKEKVERS